MGANAVTTVPVYTAGEVLTAADMNITNSGIPVFATTVTRDAAFGGAGEKTLAEGQFAYIEATNTTQYYDGAAWTALAPTREIAVFNETQAQGTLGGTSVAATWTKRTLNTSVYNTITGCSIASSVITLPAGTFYIEGSSPVFKANRTKMKLRNTTAGTDAIIGMSMFTNATSDPAVINPMFSGTVVTTASTTFEMQYYTQAAYASEGLGVGNNIASTAEVYGTIYIEKIV
jgi:hypothetical protein